MNAQILINCGADWFEFSKSKTGQLDYVGKLQNVTKPDVKNYVEFTGSTFYSPADYLYLTSPMIFNTLIYVAPGVDVSDKDVFDYLLHIGPVLAAVEQKDSLLAGQLYFSRHYVFEKFAQLTQYVLNPLCVEILFSLCYGIMNNLDAEKIPVLFESAKKKLDFDPAKENLDQSLIRWFGKNKWTITLPLVGTGFFNWENGIDSEILDKLTDNLNPQNLLENAEQIRNAKHNLFQNLKISVQAEPYNRYDKNSILVCIEDIQAKLKGNPGLKSAGHLRAYAAKILRESNPSKMSYKAELNSLSYDTITVKVSA